MITNQNDINNYSQYNKQYLPNGYINNNWLYSYNGDYLHIITDQNCYMNYNTQYCTCYNYNWKTNVMEIGYNCRRSDQYTSLYTNQLTSDINYSERIVSKFNSDKTIILSMFILAIIIAILFTKGRL